VVAKPDYLSEARLKTAGDTFFESIPPGADAYVLKRIIHDWDLPALLRTCPDAVAAGEQVIVVDAVLLAGSQPHPSKAFDLLMMVLLGRRECAESDFRNLFGRGGLKINRIVPASAITSVIEGERV
jgi:hypothetical protein